MADRPDINAKLTQRDVEELLANPSGLARVATADKVAAVFESDRLTPSERAIGEEIFRIMMRDAEVRVRAALSQHLRNSPNLPRDLAIQLARDADDVAIPMLRSSSVLTDTDLIELVHGRSSDALAAIAARQTISEPLAKALIEDGDARTAATLAGNPGAEMSEPLLQETVDRFGKSPLVQEALVQRPSLPLTIAERLVSLVSDQLRDYLLAHHDLHAETVSDVILASREKATVGLLPPGLEGNVDVERLVEQLHNNRRLSPSLILRTLCLGDVSFFELALARMAGVPVTNVRVLIHDGGALGFRAIYQRANLPPDMYAVFRVAFEVARETQYDSGEHDRERFVRRVLERILTQGETIAVEDEEYLLRKLEEYSLALA